MMYPIEEYTSYTLLWGTSSHYKEALSSPLLLKPKGEECPSLPPPRASGASEEGVVVARAWEQGGRGRLRLLRGGNLSPRASLRAGVRPFAPAQGWSDPPFSLARRSEGGSPRPRACFRPPKEAEFASDYPSSGVKLTVSGGFAHATGACLLPELNLAPALRQSRRKISRLPPLLARLRV